MNKRERVIAALNCQDTDRTPIYDLIRNDAVIEYFSGEKLDVSNPERTLYRAYNSYVDATKSNIRFPSVEDRIKTIDGEEYVTKRWTDWKIKHEFYDYGRIEVKVIKKMQELKAQRASPAASVFKYMEDYNSKLELLSDAMIFHNAPIYGGGLYYTYSFCGGVDVFSYLKSDNEDLCEEFINESFLNTLGYISRIPSDYNPPAVIIAEDIGFNKGTLFSPAYLREVLFPRLKVIVEKYHERNIKVILHSDGDINPVLDDIVSCGFDGIHPVEIIAGMDIKEIRSKYPGLVLLGGVDCSQLLPFGKADEVYSVVKKNMQYAKYGYFAGSSSEINNVVPLENILALYEAVGGII